MPTLLHIDASASLQTSVSRALSADFVERWRGRHPEGRVVRRDLAVGTIEPVTQAWIAAAFTPATARTGEQQTVLRTSDALVEELRASDEIVIGTAMYNFTVPGSLKLWIDQIVRLGETYAYVDGQRQGLLRGKRAHVFLASGGVYEAGSPAAAVDFLSPYLRAILGYIGIDDVQIYCAGGTQALLKPGADRAAFIQHHVGQAHRLEA